MFGITFSMFLVFLLFGFVSAFVLQVLVRYRTLAGVDGFLSKWIAGWGGAWLGSPVFGHWGPHVGGAYLVSAIIGAFAGPFVITALFKASIVATSAAPRPGTTASQAPAPTQFEMKKAS